MKPLLSFIVPAYNRAETIDRCIRSIVSGGMTTKRYSYEIVIVNDCSTDNTKEKIDRWKGKYPYHITGLDFIEHMERVIATNAGFLQAQGEWVMRLDSDDEIASHFKTAFEDAIALHPDARIFNWGSLVHWRNQDGRYHKTEVRQPYRLAMAENGKCETFKSGGICFGGFAFKKSCLNVTGYLPQTNNCYEFGKMMKTAHKEIKELYGDKDDLGNPWGDDYALYFKLTRHWMPVTLDEILHVQHVRQ